MSEYATHSTIEDFAETHQAVLSKWDKLTSQDSTAWSSEYAGLKKAAILRAYGHEVPDFTPLDEWGNPVQGWPQDHYAPGT